MVRKSWIDAMKILFVCQHYKPEPFRLSDICEDLVQRGHEVAVLTGIPNYPAILRGKYMLIIVREKKEERL